MDSLHIIGSKHSGGAERFFCRLTAALAESGHATAAICPPQSAVARELPPPVRQYPVAMRGLWDLWSRWQIRKLIRLQQPRIVQTYMGRATRLTHLPASGASLHIARLGGYYDIAQYRHAHAWVTNTRGLADHCVQNGLPHARVFVIANFAAEPAPVSDAQRASLRARLAIPDHARVWLTLGRLHPNKGFDDLLAAFAQAAEADTHLLIIGDGDARRVLQQQAQALNLAARVHFAGWQNELSPYFALAEWVICPSHHEAFGNVLIEAWAHGVPLISTRTAAAQELLRAGEDALITEVANPQAMAATLKQARKLGETERQIMVEAGREQLMRNYSKSAIVKAYQDLYAQLIKK